ncbi:MAG TPA: hypothetical protein VFE59_10755 [Trebonia sp.]|jgi:hypothetical protein|nr:hypothetical protein [Trebonia sp.]
MAANTDDRTQSAERATDDRTPTGERITVALVPKVAVELQRLQERTRMSKTDLTNRAITLYEFIEAQTTAGREVLIRDPETGETQLVRFL